VLVLSRSEVVAALDVDELLEALARAFVEVSAGRASVPPRVVALTPAGFLGAMAAHVDGTLASKLVSVFTGNHQRELPSHQALVALFDADDGRPLAVMDGTSITAIRTAAASALATRTLARKNAVALAVLGAGVQGRSHLEVVPLVRRFREIRVASRTRAHAQEAAETFGAAAVESFEDAVRGAEVVCLCTDSPEPVIDRSWLAPGTHVTSVGYSKQGGELDRATVRAGLLVVESRVALEPPPAGAAELEGMAADEVVELGEILSGAHPGRTSAEEITVYKSMGHAAEDAAAARLVYERALADGLGTTVEL
jgi:ornithine cyclodeaminase/alanine dehydrogenase-like protein (mu-crystallin family)